MDLTLRSVGNLPRAVGTKALAPLKDMLKGTSLVHECVLRTGWLVWRFVA